MRALLAIAIAVLAAACASRGGAAAEDDGIQDSAPRELRAFAASPRGDRLARIDDCEGGGAAGFTGYCISVATVGHPWHDVALVRAHDVAVAWTGDADLLITGCFDDWDRDSLSRGLARGFDGVDANATRRCGAP